MKSIKSPVFYATQEIVFTDENGKELDVREFLSVDDAMEQFEGWVDSLLDKLPIAVGQPDIQDKARVRIMANLKDVGTDKAFQCRLINIEELDSENKASRNELLN